MKKLKMILPMMAFVFAIALSFATVNPGPERADETGRVNGPNGWESITADCGDGDEFCKVKFSPSGQEYQVYETDETTPRTGSSSKPILIIRE